MLGSFFCLSVHRCKEERLFLLDPIPPGVVILVLGLVFIEMSFN